MKKILTILLLAFGSFSSQGQPTITADGPLEFCYGDTVTLCLTQPNTSQIWSNGATSQCMDVTNSGSYHVVFLDSIGNIDSSLVQTPVEVVVHRPEPIMYCYNFILFVTEHWESYQWFMNGDLIPNATDSSYAVVQSGNYQVTVTDSYGCEGTSVNFEYTIHGCYDPQSTQEYDIPEFSISPNPVNAHFTILHKTSCKEKMLLEFFDLTGQIIQLQPLAYLQNDIPIDVSDLPNGIYLVSLTTENGQRHSERLVVQHE